VVLKPWRPAISPVVSSAAPATGRCVATSYVDARARVTHELRCEAALLTLPPDAAITGGSAATVRGCALARPWDPVEAALRVCASR
jgi:hypothetical protein